MTLSVVILTYNEELNLPDCLASLREISSHVFVVDAGSTDRTREIAAAHGTQVFEHPFQTHAAQWSWALANLPLSTDWVLALDADQQLTPELRAELRSLDGSALDDVDGCYINRRQVFRGRWIRHGGYYPKYLLKLFRRDRVIIDETDLVDHHFYVNGRVRKLEHDLIESNRKEDKIAFWIDKHNRYASLLAREEVRSRTAEERPVIDASLLGTPDQRVLAQKRIWRKMPLFVRPFLYFAYRYFARGGFLDGREGAIFHFMQAFWFRLLVDINMSELIGEGRNRTFRGAPASAGTRMERR